MHCERAIDDFDGANDAGAKAAGLGENQSHPVTFFDYRPGY